MATDDHRVHGNQPGLTRGQLVERAGVDSAFVDRLVANDILAADPGDGYTIGDVRRATIMYSLDEAGMTLETVGEALRAGVFDLGFVDDPAYGLFAGASETTFADLGAATGVPLELLFAIREAMGLPQPAPTDRVRLVELRAVPAIQLMVRNGVRARVAERALRASGDSLRRVAEVEADWWMSDVIQPIVAAGGSMGEIGPKTAAFANEFAALDDQLILALYHGHQANAWMKNIFEGFEAALERAGLLRRVDRPPAICFLDLSGYTRLTEERGDAAAADLAGRLARLVQRTSGLHGGKPIKWLGDGVMFHFRDPGPAVLAALEMVEGAREADLPPAHVGLHAGPVLFQEGDYFGRTVNIAARIADYARQGEVLVSDEVVAASTIPDVRFDSIGPVELKGLSEAVSLHVARRAT